MVGIVSGAKHGRRNTLLFLMSQTLNCKTGVRRKKCLGNYDILMGKKIGRDKTDGAHTKNEEASTTHRRCGNNVVPVNECYKCR